MIGSVFPPGATLGTTAEWTLRGRGLGKAKGVMVSGTGVEIVGFEGTGETSAVATVKVAQTAEPGVRELRVEGPEGISNLVLVRLDTLPQSIEAEPNDEPGSAQTIAVGSAVVGVLKATDVDHYRVDAPPGRELTVDLEARRVGTSITPVLSILNRRGAAIAQARDARGGDHDCRLSMKVPPGGSFIVQVRDNTYAGDETAVYRLRVTTTPYATGIYPPGGPGGKPLAVSIAGGSLKAPLSKTIVLPDTPGTVVDPGTFDGPDGPITAPGSVIVGEANDLIEPADRKDEALTIAVGQTVNARIGRRNEVDRYTIRVKKGEKLRIKVQAEPLGSWLDSVLTVRDKKGATVAENDDIAGADGNVNRGRVNVFGLSGGTSDSVVDLDPAADDTLTVEVTDRYGEGGPEFVYRLSAGVPRPDFAVQLLIGNPNANGQINQVANNARVRLAPGLFGVFNIQPGSTTPVNFIVIPEGRPGPVTVHVEGLPEGVTVEPVKVDVLGPKGAGGQPSVQSAPSRADSFVLNAASYAEPGSSTIRVVATAEPVPGRKITRVATAMIGLESVSSPIPARPITRRIDRFPIRVIGENRPRLVGPPRPPRLLSVRVPGVLLQGDRIDLGLDFDSSPIADPGFEQSFKATARGVGLATNTVISSGMTLTDPDAEPTSDVLVRVLASAKATPGVYPVTIRYAIGGGEPVVREVPVVVRAPVELLLRPDPIAIRPGEVASLRVGVRRQEGCEAEVEVKVEGLPRGAKLTEPLTIGAEESSGDLKIEMAPTAKALSKPSALRIVAIVRMPRGSVPLESAIRPMLVAPAAEEKGRGRIE